jgi:hypothetical protein
MASGTVEDSMGAYDYLTIRFAKKIDESPADIKMNSKESKKEKKRKGIPLIGERHRLFNVAAPGRRLRAEAAVQYGGAALVIGRKHAARARRRRERGRVQRPRERVEVEGPQI